MKGEKRVLREWATDEITFDGGAASKTVWSREAMTAIFYAIRHDAHSTLIPVGKFKRLASDVMNFITASAISENLTKLKRMDILTLQWLMRCGSVREAYRQTLVLARKMGCWPKHRRIGRH